MDLILQLEGIKLDFLREIFNNRRRIKRMGILPLYRKRTKFLRYCQLKEEKDTMRLKGKIGRPNRSVSA